MVEIKEKERAEIELTCIPDVSIEKALELYEIGFKHLSELLEFTLDEEAKAKGLVEVLNYRILSHFLDLEDEEIPTRNFKCPFCSGNIFADEEECGECGVLLLEEVLEVEMEDVYEGLRKIIDTVIENPEGAKKFLEMFREGEVEGAQAGTEIVLAEIEESLKEEKESGFVAVPVIPDESGKNYLIVISPLGEHEEERKKVFEDLMALGAGDTMSFSIFRGNIIHKQEEAIRTVLSKLVREQDFEALGTRNLFILNLKIAKFLESKATVTIEDNRHFLSSLDEIRADSESIMEVSDMLYDAELIREMRKIGEKFVLDGVSFNNDPLSFLLVRECIPILMEKGLDIHILDVVANTNFINEGDHNGLMRMLQEWKRPEL